MTAALSRLAIPGKRGKRSGALVEGSLNLFLPFIFALYPLCLVGLAHAWLLGAKRQNQPRCAMLAATCGSMVGLAFLAGPWAFTSCYLRYVSLGSFALAIVYTYRLMKADKAIVKGRSRPRRVLVLLLFTALDLLAVAAYYQPGEHLNLSFPLTSGSYYVLQGGNSVVTNPFHVLSGTRLALDIVKLNRFGNRGGGIAPGTLNNYEIFGERLCSPCNGTVLSVRDGLPDSAPGRPDAEHPEGNHIVLKCGDAKVFLAHLKRGSISVAVGEVVAIGQPLGEIGNSGNTLEPHLHISATKGGAEIGLRFNGRKLSVNSVVTR